MNGLKNYEPINTKFKTEAGLLIKPEEKHFGDSIIWAVMQSMREIDTNSFVKIELPKNRKK